MKLIIHRISSDNFQTIGELLLIGSGKVERFCTVELPWRDNERNKSCIPTGKYVANREDHAKFGKCIRIDNVPGRSGILIHVANFHHQLQGCIAPGMGFSDIDRDGHQDVVQSRVATNRLYDAVGEDSFIIEIVNLW